MLWRNYQSDLHLVLFNRLERMSESPFKDRIAVDNYLYVFLGVQPDYLTGKAVLLVNRLLESGVCAVALDVKAPVCLVVHLHRVAYHFKVCLIARFRALHGAGPKLGQPLNLLQKEDHFLDKVDLFPLQPLELTSQQTEELLEFRVAKAEQAVVSLSELVLGQLRKRVNYWFELIQAVERENALGLRGLLQGGGEQGAGLVDQDEVQVFDRQDVQGASFCAPQQEQVLVFGYLELLQVVAEHSDQSLRD